MIRNNIAQPFIVIGMHRSGTTLLANAMNDAGIFMGVVRDHNGEAMHFLSLNQQMLWAEGVDWLNPKVPSKANSKTLPANEIFAEHLKSDSSNPTKLRLLHNILWGWKDPRNTFTLVHWLRVFPKAKVIHVLRDGRDVAKSLQARNEVEGEVFNPQLSDLSFNFALWERYVNEGLSWKAKLGRSYFEVKYEDLVEGNEVALRGLNHFTGMNVSKEIKPKSPRPRNFSDDLNALAAQSDLFKKLGYHI